MNLLCSEFYFHKALIIKLILNILLKLLLIKLSFNLDNFKILVVIYIKYLLNIFLIFPSNNIFLCNLYKEKYIKEHCYLLIVIYF